MKTFAILAISAFAAVSASAQGTVNFANRVSGVFITPVYGVSSAAAGVQLRGNATTNGGAVNYTGVPLLAGSGFTAELWSGVDAAALVVVPGSQVTFRTTATLVGVMNALPAAIGIPNVAASATGTFQLRAWNNVNGTVTTWAAALANQTVLTSGGIGSSAPFLMGPLGDPLDASKLPANMTGLTSFNLTIVPEPGVIALGVLGLGALLLRRRK
jgi:hypothetical protein